MSAVTSVSALSHIPRNQRLFFGLSRFPSPVRSVLKISQNDSGNLVSSGANYTEEGWLFRREEDLFVVLGDRFPNRTLQHLPDRITQERARNCFAGFLNRDINPVFLKITSWRGVIPAENLNSFYAANDFIGDYRTLVGPHRRWCEAGLDIWHDKRARPEHAVKKTVWGLAGFSVGFLGAAMAVSFGSPWLYACLSAAAATTLGVFLPDLVSFLPPWKRDLLRAGSRIYQRWRSDWLEPAEFFARRQSRKVHKASDLEEHHRSPFSFIKGATGFSFLLPTDLHIRPLQKGERWVADGMVTRRGECMILESVRSRVALPKLLRWMRDKNFPVHLRDG